MLTTLSLHVDSALICFLARQLNYTASSTSWNKESLSYQRTAVRARYPSYTFCFDLLRGGASSIAIQTKACLPRSPILPKPFLCGFRSSSRAPRQGTCTGGFVIVWLQDGTEAREAFVADIPAAINELWSQETRKSHSWNFRWSSMAF